MRQIIAILRGVTPSEVEAIGAALITAGITRIEVPLNSPEPLESIARLVKSFDGQAQLGAGTVLSAEDVRAVADTGAGLIVSPNANPAVIAETKRLGLASYPGVFTPTECFAALEAGGRRAENLSCRADGHHGRQSNPRGAAPRHPSLRRRGDQRRQSWRMARGGRERVRHRLGAL